MDGLKRWVAAVFSISRATRVSECCLNCCKVTRAAFPCGEQVLPVEYDRCNFHEYRRKTLCGRFHAHDQIYPQKSYEKSTKSFGGCYITLSQRFTSADAAQRCFLALALSF